MSRIGRERPPSPAGRSDGHGGPDAGSRPGDPLGGPGALDEPETRAIDVRALRLGDEAGPVGSADGHPPTPRDHTGRRRAAWALAVAIVALVAALFGAWALPIGVVAVVLALLAVRRGARRGMAVWALALAVLALLYGAGWLAWTLGQL